MVFGFSDFGLSLFARISVQNDNIANFLVSGKVTVIAIESNMNPRNSITVDGSSTDFL